MQICLKELHGKCPDVSEAFLQKVADLLRWTTTSGKELLYLEGLTGSPLLFIRKGSVKCYRFVEDKEVLMYIANENEFVCYPPCWGNDEGIRIEAMTNCEFFSFPLRQWATLRDSDPLEATKLEKYLILNENAKRDKRVEVLSMHSAEDRLQMFRKNFPEKYEKLPDTLIAPLINVCAHTVRRIIKRTVVKKK
jgi:CRP-like cAMP-binding protein